MVEEAGQCAIRNRLKDVLTRVNHPQGGIPAPDALNERTAT
jgi:hypothetical protein